MRLTKRMVEVLKAADLEAGVVNDVPLATWWGLLDRGLVRRGNPPRQTTVSGQFPHYGGVPLTQAGIRAARGLLGMAPLPVPGREVRPNV